MNPFVLDPSMLQGVPGFQQGLQVPPYSPAVSPAQTMQPGAPYPLDPGMVQELIAAIQGMSAIPGQIPGMLSQGAQGAQGRGFDILEGQARKEPPQMGSLLSGDEAIKGIVTMLLLAAFGVPTSEITAGGQGFLGARQLRSEQQFKGQLAKGEQETEIAKIQAQREFAQAETLQRAGEQFAEMRTEELRFKRAEQKATEQNLRTRKSQFYTSITDPGELDSIFRELQGTPFEIPQSVYDKKLHALGQKELASYISQRKYYEQNYDLSDPDANRDIFTNLTELRATLIDDYGFKEAEVLPPRDEKTIKQAKIEQQQRQYEEKKKFAETKWAWTKDFMDAKEYERSKEAWARIEIARENVALSRVRADIYGMNLYRLAQGAMDAASRPLIIDAQKKSRDISAEIEEWKAELVVAEDPERANPKRAQAIKDKIKALADKKRVYTRKIDEANLARQDADMPPVADDLLGDAQVFVQGLTGKIGIQKSGDTSPISPLPRGKGPVKLKW